MPMLKQQWHMLINVLEILLNNDKCGKIAQA